MRIFSYVVVSDSGFAPNPFWGHCTLAACKPVIRRTAHVGDWVAGLSPKASGNRLVYAMQVTEKIPIEAYFADSRFAAKKPDFDRPELVWHQGDNVYEPGPQPGQFRQLRSRHSLADGGEDLSQMRHDLSGLYVLISDRYWYFGGEGPRLPDSLEPLKVGRGHRTAFPPGVVGEFLGFIDAFPPGVHGRPTRWRDDDATWSSQPA